MSDFKKMCITFSILKLQKCDAYQNGVEFRHKPKGDVVKWPPHSLFLPLPNDADYSDDDGGSDWNFG